MIERADLRLADLGTLRVPDKLMNVRVPANLVTAIARIADELGCSKTAVVIALLNEGLDALAAHPPPARVPSAPRRPRRGRPPRSSRKTTRG